MITILVTGLPGQLATSLRDYTKNSNNLTGIQFIFTNRAQFDITNDEQCLNFISNSPNNISYIINCAAYTNVDQAETEQETAYQVNSLGPLNLAKLANKFNLKLIQISTDYVFPEIKTDNKPYTEDDATNPVNYYGKSKLEGERNIITNTSNYLIIRTGWLYYHYGKNFFNTILNLAKQKDSLTVVDDQFGTPTYCADLCKFIIEIIKQDLQNSNKNLFANIHNFSNLGQCSWFEFATSIVNQAGINCKILPISSKDYPTKAVRPKFSVLDKTKAIGIFGELIPNWEKSLVCCLNKKYY